jgi:hypothetical protein
MDVKGGCWTCKGIVRLVPKQIYRVLQSARCYTKNHNPKCAALSGCNYVLIELKRDLQSTTEIIQNESTMQISC